MTPAETIEYAISRGEAGEFASLSPTERAVWLISEAETLCDMEGIDSFLSRYGGDLLSEAAVAFHSVGALQIAEALRAIQAAPPEQSSDELLNEANRLICGRVGYDYDSILRYVSVAA